ncbi:hypothetical protein PV458_32885 [Streptomyces sp. MN03-5084-2B]|nr:hypothetical protein [Streptomyces sp. MN03-5084-2B]
MVPHFAIRPIFKESICSAGGGAVCARIQFENSLRGQQETRTSTIRWIFVTWGRLIPRGYRQSAAAASRKAES